MNRRGLASGWAFVLLALVVGAAACGETRRPIGEECLRDEDCLSGLCAARACVSAPTYQAGAGEPAEEEPDIPDASASGG